MNEFYEIEPLLTSDDFTPKNGLSDDEVAAVLAVLSNLYQFYMKYSTASPEYVVDNIENDANELYETLSYSALEVITTYFNESFNKDMDKFYIPNDYLSFDLDEDIDIVLATIVATVNQLRDNALSKAKHYIVNMKNFQETFNLNSNFKEAVTKINNLVSFNLMNAKEKGHREVMKFVYGEEMLYAWKTAGDMRVCGWCIDLSKSEPKTIDKFPLDHPHGRCWLEPVNQNYTEEYRRLLS